MRRALAVAAALSCLLAVAPAAHAEGICPFPYPDPRISLTGTASEVKSGTEVRFGGNLTRNGCALPPGPVGFYVRVAGTGGRFFFYSQAHSNAFGGFQFKIKPVRSFDAMIVYSGQPDYPRAQSRVWRVTVSPNPSNSGHALAGCDMPRALPAGATPPKNVEVSLRLPVRSGVSGEALSAEVVIRNNGARPLVFQHEKWRDTLLLRNTKTGELPTPTSFTDALASETIEIPGNGKGKAIVATTLKTCQRPSLTTNIWPGTFDVIGSIGVRLADGTSQVWSATSVRPIPVSGSV